jgi:hypothetical protein
VRSFEEAFDTPICSSFGNLEQPRKRVSVQQPGARS